VRKFALFNNNFQQALGASSELFKFMDSEMKFVKSLEPAVPAFSSSIRFDDVSFSYEGNATGARDPSQHQSESESGRGAGSGRFERAGKSTLVH